MSTEQSPKAAVAARPEAYTRGNILSGPEAEAKKSTEAVVSSKSGSWHWAKSPFST